MMRIARVDGGATQSGTIPTLQLEGKLVGPWVDELGRACAELQTPPSGLRLDLSAVTFIDPAGITLLAELVRRGATLTGCSGFIEELLCSGRSLVGLRDKTDAGQGASEPRGHSSPAMINPQQGSMPIRTIPSPARRS